MLVTCKEVCVEVKYGGIKYVFVSYEQNTRQNHDLKIANEVFENMKKSRYLEFTL